MPPHEEKLPGETKLNLELMSIFCNLCNLTTVAYVTLHLVAWVQGYIMSCHHVQEAPETTGILTGTAHTLVLGHCHIQHDLHVFSFNYVSSSCTSGAYELP